MADLNVCKHKQFYQKDKAIRKLFRKISDKNHLETVFNS